MSDPFGAIGRLSTGQGDVNYYRLEAVAGAQLDRLPHTVKILLENLLRRLDGREVSEEDVRALAAWHRSQSQERELAFLPGRVLLQDFTGVPAVVDLAAMRSAIHRLGGDPERINPLVPVDLVIDHSVQVDVFGSPLAFARNVEREYERNRERYALLRWAQSAFRNFRVVPPGTGIVHQVNLEYLASVVRVETRGGAALAYPDTLVGTDSHTTMINGLGVLGWGVGGIEAEAVMLGQPIVLLTPQVVGLRLTGHMPEGSTATDLVLTVTQLLRKHGVVGRFVEFSGPGLDHLPLADRATLSNMAPEYGATAALFPVDEETLRYLRLTGRDEAQVELVERYTKSQGLFRTSGAPEPEFTELRELDLSTVEPSLAGPRRPQDRVPLRAVRETFRTAFADHLGDGDGRGSGESDGRDSDESEGHGTDGGNGLEPRGDGLRHGSVVIAAITSCTNTSNPAVMLGAGLVARKAVERGLRTRPYVKTSLAPGSRAVTDYLRQAGLMPYLEVLGFHLVGYGCTTCIGNSGPLPEEVAEQVRQQDLVVAAVLSGNRNFEGRIHPQTRAAFLASPPLVVAYALAGTVEIDLSSEPIGTDASGHPVYLREIWPTRAEVEQAIAASLSPEAYRQVYGQVFEGDEHWRALEVPEGGLYAWDPASTYIQEPPFFEGLSADPAEPTDIAGARVLVMLGDSVTTDHISPAGAIPVSSPAGQYLVSLGVKPFDFNSFGARRGNDRVMVRGTFGNLRLRNQLVPDAEGDWTLHLPDGERLRIFEASQRYRAAGVPLIVVAGKEYGSGSSRDWAAKGPLLLGLRAVIAESFERIHRSNLLGMGILPLEFLPGEGRRSLGLTGRETYDIRGLAAGLQPRQQLTVVAQRPDGSQKRFQVLARLDSPVELDYYRHGGVPPYLLRRLMA